MLILAKSNCLTMDAAMDLIDLSHNQMMTILGFCDKNEHMNEITDIGKLIISCGKSLN